MLPSGICWKAEQTFGNVFSKHFSNGQFPKSQRCAQPSKLLLSPNEDLGVRAFVSTFQIREYSIWATFIWKVFRKYVPECFLGLPNSSFGDHNDLCSPTEEIGEIRKHISDRVFKELFACVSTSCGRLTIKKCFENTVWNVGSAFQNLRLGWVEWFTMEMVKQKGSSSLRLV